MPKPFELRWPNVREYLTDTLKLPKDLIDKLHNDGLIYSDRRSNCVFVRDQDSGVFKVGTGSTPFIQTLGKDGGPLVIPGTDNKAFITDSPLEALALKAMHPDSTIMATGEFIPTDKLNPYLGGHEITVAMKKTSNANIMARYILDAIPKAEYAPPKDGRDWNEAWVAHLNKTSQKASDKPHQRNNQTTTTQTRTTGLSR